MPGEHLNEMFGKKYPKNFRKEHIEYHKDEPEELAVINYTSGTTSYSKGVMLPYRSLWSNTKFAYEVLELKAGDKIVSMLPMAHMYGLASNSSTNSPSVATFISLPACRVRRLSSRHSKK